jgi:thiol-disulfide isomerase/thioredoxin
VFLVFAPSIRSHYTHLALAFTADSVRRVKLAACCFQLTGWLEWHSMKKRIDRLLLLALFMGGLLALDFAPAWSQGKVDYKVVPILQPMKDTAPTPEFNLSTPAGKKISLKDFRGKLVLLNFWASWCVPCREEMPAMEKLYQEYKDKNFVVLAVAVKDRKQDAVDFAKELKISYPIALDPEAQVGSLYGAWGLPATYLIGPKGEGLARGWGPAEWYGSNARKLVKDLLDGKR